MLDLINFITLIWLNIIHMEIFKILLQNPYDF